MTLEQLIQSLKDSYGAPKVDEDEQKITIIKDVIRFFREEIDSGKYEMACIAIKKYHSTRYGFPDLCDCNKAIKQWEKENNIALEKGGDYYTSKHTEKEPLPEAMYEGKMDFNKYFRDLMKANRVRDN